MKLKKIFLRHVKSIESLCLGEEVKLFSMLKRYIQDTATARVDTTPSLSTSIRHGVFLADRGKLSQV